MTPAYLAEVERAFVGHAGRGLLLSPLDREKVAGWARAGVPAAVIVEGIERAFDRPDGAPKPRARGIGFAVPAIEASIKAWQHAQLGRHEATPDPGAAIEAAFVGLLGRVEAAGRGAREPGLSILRDMWRAITDLQTRWRAGGERDPIKAVITLEQRQLDRALGELDRAERQRIEDEVSMALDGYSIHDELTRRITRQALQHDAMRRRFGLPALELRF